MALKYQVPKSARFLQTVNFFTGTFNTPTVGVYDFGIAANTKQIVLEMQPLSVYFLERCNVGGDIAEADFLGAISVFPKLVLSTRTAPQTVYRLPLPIVNYIDNQEINAWIYSEQASEALLATMTGILNGTAALVGIAELRLAVSFNLYEVSDSDFLAAFRSNNRESFIGAHTDGRQPTNDFRGSSGMPTTFWGIK